MGLVKTFNEFIKESTYYRDDLVENIYNAIVDSGFGDYFYEPDREDESPSLISIVDAFDLDNDYDVTTINFKDGGIFNNNDVDFYKITICDNLPNPFNPEDGEPAQIYVEFGEKGYEDGAEPWFLYYMMGDDTWDTTGGIEINHNTDENLARLISAITMAINPNTQYTPEYFGLE